MTQQLSGSLQVTHVKATGDPHVTLLFSRVDDQIIQVRLSLTGPQLDSVAAAAPAQGLVSTLCVAAT